MIHHCYFLAKGTYSDRYQINTATKIYYVFEFNSCKLAVIEVFKHHVGLMRFKDYFFFKSKQALAQSFNTNWDKPSGEKASFFKPS